MTFNYPYYISIGVCFFKKIHKKKFFLAESRDKVKNYKKG